MVYKSLNKYFDLPDIPQYYFFVMNFGPIKMEKFVHLKNITCLSGPNGSGKSSFMDAVKTAIIGNQKYLVFNPKGGKKVELKDYLNLYNKQEKIGPTILIFSIDFPDNSRGYRSAAFGIGWSNDIKGKYFYKEMITRVQITPLIKKALDLRSFLKSLEMTDLPGKLHIWGEPIEYHRFLDKEKIFFYFPKSYEDSKSYFEFLNLLKECAKTLTSTNVVDSNVLKKNLFQPRKSRSDLENSFNKIERSLQYFGQYHKIRNDREEKVKTLKFLLDLYENYYKDFEIKVLANILIKIEEEMEDFKEKIEKIRLEKAKNEKESIDFEEKMCDTKNILDLKLTYEEKIAELHNEWEICSNYYVNNENVFKLDVSEANLKLNELYETLKNYETKILQDSSTYKRMETITENKKNILTDLKKNREIDLELIDKYSYDIEIAEDAKNENQNELDIVINLIKKNQEIKKNVEEIYDKMKKEYDIECKDDIKIQIKNMEELLNKLNVTRDNKKKLIKEIQNGNKENDITYIKYQKQLNEKFGIKKLYQFFDNSPYEDLIKFETIYQNYKDYYIIPKSKEPEIHDIIKFSKENEKNIRLILLGSSENPMDLCNVEREENRKILVKIFKNQIIYSLKLIDKPRFFGKEQRKNTINELKNELENINKRIEVLKENLTEIIEISGTIDYLDQKLVENDEKLKKRVEIKQINEFLDDLKEKISEFNKKIKNLESLQDEIASEEEYRSKLEDLSYEIEANKKNIDFWKSELDKSKENRDKTQILINKVEDQIQNLPEITKKWDRILTDLIDNAENLLKISLSKNAFQNELSRLLKIKKSISNEKEQLIEEITQRRENIKNLKEKIKINKDRLSNINIELKELSLEQNNLLNKHENCLKNTKQIIFKKLTLDLNTNIDNFNSWFKQELENSKMWIKNNYFDQNIIKTQLINEWNILFENVCIKFNIKSENISKLDKNYHLEIKSIFMQLNIDKNIIKIQDHFLTEIKQMDEKLEQVCNSLVSDVTSFLDLIVSEIRYFNSKAKKYNLTAGAANFGTLDKLVIEIQNDNQYEALRDFRNYLDNASQEGILKEIIIDIINKKSLTLSEYFSKEILKDPHAKSRDFLDIYQYFDFEIYSVNSEGIKRSALSSSGGESTGVKFLIYALAFHNLRLLEESGESFYAKPVFIYFDEAAAVDPQGIRSIIMISDLLKINAIIAMVEAPAIHDSKLIDYIMANGVVNSGFSDVITEIESANLESN